MADSCSRFKLILVPKEQPHPTTISLVHLSHKSVDVLLPVTEITALDVVLELACPEATSGVGQLEWPQEVAHLLEVGTDSEDLVNHVFHTDNTKLAKVLLDQLVVGERNSLLVDLAISTLVDELTDGLQVGVAIGDVGVDDCKHLLCGFGEFDEDTIVDLKESEELEDLARLRSNLVDTLNTKHEDKLGLVLDVEAAVLSAQTRKSDLFALGIAVLLDVALSLLEDDLSLLLVGL